MPNITFFIDRKNIGLDGKAPVKVNVSINSKNVNKTVTRIKPAYWYLKDARKQNAEAVNTNNTAATIAENGAANVNKKKAEHRKKPSKTQNDKGEEIEQYCKAGGYSDPDYDQDKTNQVLHEFKKDLSAYFQQCEIEKITVTPESVKAYFKGEKVTPGTNKDFFQAWDEFVIWGEKIKGKKENTNRGIKAVGNLLKTFRDNKGFDLTFDNITPEFFERLKEYMLFEKDYSERYFASTIRKLKAFLNSDFTSEYYQGTEHKKFKAADEPGTLIYLTFDELSKLYKHDFKNPKYDRVRDIFVFASLTGLRISDWKKLNRANIVGDMLVKRVKKTNQFLELPFLPEAMAIIEKYKHQYKVLPKISEQKFNEYIKQACEIAEINALVEVEPNRKSERPKTYKKWQLVSSHVARKSFVTGMVKRGFEIKLIMEFAGIKDQRTLNRYLHLDNDYKREQLKKWGSL